MPPATKQTLYFARQRESTNFVSHNFLGIWGSTQYVPIHPPELSNERRRSDATVDAIADDDDDSEKGSIGSEQAMKNSIQIKLCLHFSYS